MRKAAALVGHSLGDAVTVELAASERAATNIIPLQVSRRASQRSRWGSKPCGRQGGRGAGSHGDGLMLKGSGRAASLGQ